MIVELVTFRAPHGGDWDHILEGARGTIPKWSANPKLVRKHFLLSEDAQTCAGLYIWPSRADAGLYGHPVPGIGYKIAFDAGQVGWDPDVEEWLPDAQEETRLLAWLAERMPDVAPLVYRTQRHPWTMTPDADFIIDRRHNKPAVSRHMSVTGG